MVYIPGGSPPGRQTTGGGSGSGVLSGASKNHLCRLSGYGTLNFPYVTRKKEAQHREVNPL